MSKSAARAKDTPSPSLNQNVTYATAAGACCEGANRVWLGGRSLVRTATVGKRLCVPLSYFYNVLRGNDR